MQSEKEVVARPAGVYAFSQVKHLDCLAYPFATTGISQPRLRLASGPMGDCSLRTGPNRQRMEVRCG